jgi:hypothetical protein
MWNRKDEEGQIKKRKGKRELCKSIVCTTHHHQLDRCRRGIEKSPLKKPPRKSRPATMVSAPLTDQTLAITDRVSFF